MVGSVTGMDRSPNIPDLEWITGELPTRSLVPVNTDTVLEVAANMSATVLIDARLCVQRSLGSTRTRMVFTYQAALNEIASAWDTFPEALQDVVDGVMNDDLNYHDLLIRRGRPDEATPIRAAWRDALAAALIGACQ